MVSENTLMTFGAVRLTDLGKHIHPFKQGMVCACEKCENACWLTDKQKGIVDVLKPHCVTVLCLNCIKLIDTDNAIDLGKPNYKPDSIIEKILRSEDDFGGI